jgi:S1-C subfamily serine protease
VGILKANDAGVFCHFNRIPPVGWVDSTTTTEVWTAVASPRIAALTDSMKKGDIHPQAGRLYTLALAGADRLAAEEVADGKRMKAAFEAATRPLRGGVASILNGSVPVGLATVVDGDGLAVVMASALPLRPRCRLPDGSITDFTVVGVDKAFDLAVIRIPPKSIRAVPWADRDSLPAGTLVAAVGPDAVAANVGVVSVAPRKVADARTLTYELPLRVKADRPGIYGEPSKDGNGHTVRATSALEKSAGIRAGDRLVSIAGQPIGGEDDIAKAVRDKLSGDLVSVVLVREDRTMTVELPLLPEVPNNASNATWRSDDYPDALEYSPPVRTTASGGPLVDLSGRVVAVTVGRTSIHAGWAIPAGSVRKIVGDAKAGKLSTWPVR